MVELTKSPPRLILPSLETAQEVKNLTYQADMYDAQGSFLKKSAGNLGSSLLSAGLSGLSSGLGMYGMAGGKLSSLFGSGSGAGSAAQQLDPEELYRRLYR